MGKNNVWIHFNIYIGKLEKIDSVIEEVILPLINQLSENYKVNNWFFMRYIDQHGPHLRFRIKVPIEEWSDVIKFIESNKDSIIDQVEQMTYTPLRRLVPVNTQSNFSSEVNIELGLYDPEVTKYGGKVGIKYAEHLFNLSSKIVGYYIPKINKQGLNRFELALNIMKWSVEQTLFSEREINTFMEYYLNYWGGGSSQSPLIPQLIKQAETKGDYVEQVYNNGAMHLNDQCIKMYLTKLNTLMELANSSNEIEQTKEHLIFHYLHMMNNRLGVWPIEEAYLAALYLAKNRKKYESIPKYIW